MSDNTVQFRWIQTLVGGLRAMYYGRPDVFVAGDHLIYAEQGNPAERMAPDAYVALGRPPGDRGSYRLWEEENVFPQVVFEVWSPGNSEPEAARKRAFYVRHGAREFYYVRPERGEVQGWFRRGDEFVPVEVMNGFVSPLTGVRFEFDGEQIRVVGPDGREFVPTEEAIHQRDEAERERDEAERERDEAERERDEALEQVREARERELESRGREREAGEQATRLAEKLRALGIDPEAP